MSTPVEIVIRARDQFTPVFNSLDAAFRNTDAAGQKAGMAIAGVEQAISGMEQTAADTQRALTAFSEQTQASLSALSEAQLNHLETQGALQETFTRNLGENLIELETGFSDQRADLRQSQYQTQQAALAGHLQAMGSLTRSHGVQVLAFEQGWLEARLENFRGFSQVLAGLAKGRGDTLARIAKTAAIAEALINTYLAGSKALASVPFPFNFAAAAAVTAQGLAAVDKIRQVNIAHGGIENVPAEATFLLQRGERVLSANQNRELTRYLDATAGNPEGRQAVIENVTVHVLENATSAESLLTMERADLRRVVAERIIPALDELAELGIRPKFVDQNT